MKLHLPKGLLVAVMAACVVQPVAATIVDDSTNKTYTVTGGDGNDGDNEINPPGDSDYKLIFKITATGTDDRNYFSGNSETTHNGDVQIGDTGTEADDTQGMIITNGNGGQSGIFTGAVTGSGMLKRTGKGNTTLTFSGDATGYVGNIYLGGGTGYTFTLTFGGKVDAVAAASTTDTKGASGTGNIAIASKTNKLVYNYTKGDAPVYITNTISESGTVDGSVVTLKGGADYVFTKTVSVDTVNLEAGSLALGACNDSGDANVRSTIEVSGGAVLKAEENDRLGWGTNSTSSVVLTGSSESSLATFELGGRQTMATELNMNGHAQVTAVGSGSGDSQPGLNAFRKNGAIINVTGTNNTIAAALQTRDSFHITVEDGGSLLVSGEVRSFGSSTNGYDSGNNPYGYETGSVVKLGEGLLEFENASNTFAKKYFNMAGSTVFSHGENATATHTFTNGMTVAGGSVTIDSGATAKMGKVINVYGGASLTINGEVEVESLAEFERITAGGTLSDGANGFRTGGKEAYLIIDGAASATINKDASISITDQTATWDGNRLVVMTDTAVADSTIYEVINTVAGAVEYSSSDSKWVSATGIMMDNGTAIRLNTLLADGLKITLRQDYANAEIQMGSGLVANHGMVTTTDYQTVSYALDGKGTTLELEGCGHVSNISSLELTNGATLAVHGYGNTLGTESSKVQISLSGDSVISLKNGSGSGGPIWADILVDGSGSILGSMYGTTTDVKGTITGSGTLKLGRSDANWNDAWKISALISDGENGKLSLVYNAEKGNLDNAEAVSTLTLSGANTYSGGTEITGGTLIVSEGASLGTGNITVNGGNLEVSGENAITAAKLDISNGTVTAAYTTGSDSSVISHATTVNVGAKGTLKLTGHDMLGWGASTAPANIVLKGTDEDNVATLDIQDTGSFTGAAPIEMKGNSVLTGNVYTTFTGGNITVSEGSNNKITVSEFRARNDVVLDIAKDAVLTIESVICNGQGQEGTKDLTKSNVGTLEITNTGNTWSGQQLKVTGGTLRLVGAANLPGGVTMSADTRLETGTGTIGNLTMAGGSTLDADTAVSLNGSLTFNGVVNLDGGIKDALSSGQQSVSLFTGVTSLVLNGTTYDSTARVAYNPVDLDEVFTFDGLDQWEYQLNYSGGEIFATLTVPEPATATLSLLALAGLMARRRRAR